MSGTVPGGARLLALRDKVKGDPEAIRKTAQAWRSAANHAVRQVNSMTKAVGEVDKNWHGGSANAFVTHMKAYPRAAGDLSEALFACADALDKAAEALEDAHDKIGTLYRNAVQNTTEYRQRLHRMNPQATGEEVEAMVARSSINADAVTKAEDLVSKADDKLKAARTALEGQLDGDRGFGFFHAIPEAGGADFDPGTKRVEWIRTPHDDRLTTLASGAAPGGSDGGGASGSNGYAYTGGVSSGGNVPAPKAQIVAWIKEALTIIKHPDTASILKKRGILDNVQDLDPNDPKDIQRIWTIIHHESGGNPSAINNWDINAKNGVPSQGLMQTIPPTFHEHALPDHDEILDPVQNIIAGVLYTYSRYGSLAQHPGIASLERGGPYRPY